MKKAALALTLILCFVLSACNDSTPAEVTDTSATPQPTQTTAAPAIESEIVAEETAPEIIPARVVPYVLNGTFSAFPLEFFPKKFALVTPLTIDERYERDGQVLSLYFWSFPQFFNTDSRSDGAAIDAINSFFRTEYEERSETVALDLQKDITSYDDFFAKNGEDSPEKPSCFYDTVQYKTAVGGDFTSGNNMYNILNVFRRLDRYAGTGSSATHLYERFTCDVFSLKTGVKITLGDLFTVDEGAYIKRLSDEMYSALQGNSLVPTETLGNRYNVYQALEQYITSDSMFALSENGLTILFDPFAAGGYTNDTELWITIPYSCIGDIMIPVGEIVDIAP